MGASNGHLATAQSVLCIASRDENGCLCIAMGASNARHRDVRPISRFISETIQHTAIVIMEGEQETIPELSNVVIFNDLEWPLTQISRSRYYLTSNDSKMVQDTAILTTYMNSIVATGAPQNLLGSKTASRLLTEDVNVTDICNKKLSYR